MKWADLFTRYQKQYGIQPNAQQMASFDPNNGRSVTKKKFNFKRNRRQMIKRSRHINRAA